MGVCAPTGEGDWLNSTVVQVYEFDWHSLIHVRFHLFQLCCRTTAQYFHFILTNLLDYGLKLRFHLFQLCCRTTAQYFHFILTNLLDHGLKLRFHLLGVSEKCLGILVSLPTQNLLSTSSKTIV